MEDDRRSPDTFADQSGEDDDPILSACLRLGSALKQHAAAIDRLRAKSDPPPAPVPPAAAAMAA